MEETAPAKWRIWRMRVFTATWLSYFGYYFARKPFFVVKKDLEETFAWDAEALGILGTCYLVSYTIGQFLSGATGDRIGPKKIALIGMGGTILANAFMGFTDSFASFAVLLSLNGLFQSTGWPNNVGMMGRWFKREERGRVMGFWATNFQAGGSLATPLAAYLLNAYGFQYAFFGGSVVLSAVWIYFLFNAKNQPSDVDLPDIEEELDENGKPPGKWSSQIIANVLIIGVSYFFVKFVRYAIWSWAPYLLRTYYGLEGDDAGYISTIFDVAGIAGVIACGFISDKLFPGRRAFTSLIFLFAMIASCAMLYMFGATSLALFAAAMGLIGFSLYGPDAIMTSAGAIDVGSAKRATLAAGIINGMGSVGAVTQELLLGRVLKSDDIDTVFLLLLGSSVCAAVCLSVLVFRSWNGKATV